MESPKFTIEERIATISFNATRGTALKLNRVAFGDYPAKYDLRRWGCDNDGREMIPLKGVQLSEEEYAKLKTIFTERG